MSLCGCGSSSAASGGAGEIARQQYERMSNGDRDKVYESLLPDQRSQDVLDAFWGCTEDVMGSHDLGRDCATTKAASPMRSFERTG
jgi:hypothetical protein